MMTTRIKALGTVGAIPVKAPVHDQKRRKSGYKREPQVAVIWDVIKC